MIQAFAAAAPAISGAAAGGPSNASSDTGDAYFTTGAKTVNFGAPAKSVLSGGVHWSVLAAIALVGVMLVATTKAKRK